MTTESYANISVNYNPDNVDSNVANDIVQIAAKNWLSYPDDFFYNMAYPKLSFNLIKYNEDIGYKIVFNGYKWVSDVYLQQTKSFYAELKKKYKVSIVFLDTNGKTTLEYSDRSYWLTLLKNNLIIMILLPIVMTLSLAAGNYLSESVLPKISNQTLMKIFQELLPSIIGLPVSIIAFKIQPMITFTKTINYTILLITAFAFYMFTGCGLTGSLILLAIFVLRTIQESVS